MAKQKATDSAPAGLNMFAHMSGLSELSTAFGSTDPLEDDPNLLDDDDDNDTPSVFKQSTQLIKPTHSAPDEHEEEEEEEEEEDDDDNDDPEPSKVDPKKKAPAKEEGNEGEPPVAKRYSGFVDHLADSGVLTIDVPEDIDLDDPDSLSKVMELQRQADQQAYRDSLSPEARHYFEYVQAGGNPAKYRQEAAFTWSDPELNIEDENTQKHIIRAALKAQGLDDDDINEELEEYEANDLIAVKAKRNLKVLIKQEETNKANLLQQQQAKAAADREAAEKAMTQVREKLKNTTEIAGFPIKNPQQFYDFIYKVNPKTGKTPAMEKMAATEDFQLKVAAALWNDFQAGTPKKKATERTKVVKELEDKLAGLDNWSSGKSSGNTGGASRSDSNDISRLSGSGLFALHGGR